MSGLGFGLQVLCWALLSVAGAVLWLGLALCLCELLAMVLSVLLWR